MSRLFSGATHGSVCLIESLLLAVDKGWTGRLFGSSFIAIPGSGSHAFALTRMGRVNPHALVFMHRASELL
jgi:hypothetical protein